MQVDDRVRGKQVILAIVKFFVLMVIVMIMPLNNAFAQILHDKTLYEVVNQSSEADGPNIEVGDVPVDMVEDDARNLIYVVNSGSDSVSVISTENNTKIKDIEVGDTPVAIAFIDEPDLGANSIPDTIYVANSNSHSVSVISAENNTKIGMDIELGAGAYPTDIAIDIVRKMAYVMHSYNISMISPENNTITGNIETEDDEEYIEDIAFGTTYIETLGIPTLYTTNYDSDSVSVTLNLGKQGMKVNEIEVGNSPSAIGDDILSGQKLYVGNRDSDSVSVISTESNSKIGDDIEVGDDPTIMAVAADKIYVGNKGSAYNGSSSVSVISNNNNSRLGEDIRVGTNISDLVIYFDKVYVANSGSNSISVISGETNSKMGEDIRVGDNPIAILANDFTKTIYVANSGSDSISIIDAIADKVVAGTTFQIKPFNSGYILCDESASPSPTEQFIYIYADSKCVAKPNKGFEFLNWEENLGGNSTRLVKVSPSASPLDTIAEFLGIKSEEPEATLDIIKFGSFTANFKELPPPISSEYLIPLYGIIITSVVGWSIPSIIAWNRSRTDTRKLSHYHKKIASLYDDGKLDENDIPALNQLRDNVLDSYSKGKINEKHSESLKNEFSILYERIFRKKLNSLNNQIFANRQLESIRNEIEYAYSEGKLSELHYKLLSKITGNMASKDDQS